MFESKNYDDVFIRNVIVGITYFFYDTLYIWQVKNNKYEKLRIPMLYSFTGDEQFVKDFYQFQTWKREEVGDCINGVIGNIEQTPSGRISLTGVSIVTDKLGHGLVRYSYFNEENSEFGLQTIGKSARGYFIPIEMNFNVKIRCSSELQRFKAFQEVVRKYYKVKKFWFRFEGFNKLPAEMALPENYRTDSQFKFRYSEKTKRPILEFDITLNTYLPDMYLRTERFDEERIESTFINIGESEE